MSWATGMQFNNLHPQLAKLPMIRALLEGRIYEAHPSEPSMFTIAENGVNSYWAEWLNFVLIRGVQHGDAFVEDPRWTLTDENIVKVMLALRRMLIQNIHSPDWILPIMPPAVATPNGRFLSMAWVLDTANRDHMPLHEAVQLGHSLIR